MPSRGGDKGSHSVKNLPAPLERKMQKAAYATRLRPGRVRRSDADGTLPLYEAAHRMLAIVVDAAGAFYSVQPADSRELPVFAMQYLLADAGAVITKRRIYDVLHIWEAIGLVARASGRGMWTWYGEAGYRTFRTRVLQLSANRMSCDDFVMSELSHKVSSFLSALKMCVNLRERGRQTRSV